MKNHCRLGLVLLSLMFIAGCSTPEQRHFRQVQEQKKLRIEEQKRIEAANTQQRIEQIRAQHRVELIERRCKSYGFEPKTPAYANCLMQLDQADREIERQKSAIDGQNAAAAEARKALESRCRLEQAQIYIDPRNNGGFADTQMRASAAWERCLSGSPPLPSLDLDCERRTGNQLACRTR